ncbi:polyketide synthase [Aspergillus hancockii]|nr:polyketide synthase [Aspergillus hancockii]
MFSSIASVVGSQGQSNYAAGNTFQDEIKGHRFALNHEEAARRSSKIRFVLKIMQPEVRDLLGRYCDKHLVLDPAHSQVVTGIELPEGLLSRGVDMSGWMLEPISSILHQMDSSQSTGDSGGSTSKGSDLIRQLEAAMSTAEATDVVTSTITGKLCRALSLSPDSSDATQPLRIYGVDSLIAIEMRNWFMQALQGRCGRLPDLGGATTATLERTVAGKIKAGAEGGLST